MRTDMAKVIVERPRISYSPTRKGRLQDADALPMREGMRRSHVLRGDPKILNENLAPLRRYLSRQVGRPWNKVYAEIAANLRTDNTVQQHVRDHLCDFVAVKPRRDMRGWRHSSRTGLWWQEFYVDPVTNLLCRTDRLPEEKARRRAKRAALPESPDRIPLARDRELRRVGGLWYEVGLAPLPEPLYRVFRETVRRPLPPYAKDRRYFEAEMEIRRLVSAPVRDAVTGELLAVGPAIDNPEAWQTYRRSRADRRYATKKRTLSRNELRCHGLRNDA